MRRFVSRIAPALLLGGLLMLGLVPVRGQAAVVEDFSTFANGKTDTNKSGYLDIEDEGGKHEGWLSRQFAPYTIETVDGKPVLSIGKTSGPRGWHPMGKLHAQDVAKATAVEVTFRVALRNQYSSANVWLSDDMQNGYGVMLNRSNYNQAGIIKLRECPLKWPTVLGLPSSWTLEYADAAKKTVSVGLQNDGFITYHLRAEQEAAGKPVKLTLWFTGSTKEFPDTSYDKPAQQVTDDGTGAIFTAGEKKFGPVFDLSALTYVALTVETPNIENSSAQFGAIEVTATQPKP